jgi:hypothetical protein
VRDWTAVTRYVRATDPFGRALSIHPTSLGAQSGRGAIGDPSLLDFDMLQTGHAGPTVLEHTIRTLRTSYAAPPRMPVLNSEVAYEALFDAIPASAVRRVFWASVLSGAAGHTYGANGIWQVNRVDQAYGVSPHGANYGTIPWDRAMHLDGSRQLGLGKGLLERFAWHQFEPHPEWAAFATAKPENPWDVPYAAGIPEVVRVIYSPRGVAVRVAGLHPGAPYTAERWAPDSGATVQLGQVYPNAAGSWVCPPPDDGGSDWILVLRAGTHYDGR